MTLHPVGQPMSVAAGFMMTNQRAAEGHPADGGGVAEEILAQVWFLVQLFGRSLDPDFNLILQDVSLFFRGFL